MPTPIYRIRLKKEAVNKVQLIAKTLDCTYGGSGSIAKLLEEIADNKLIVSKNLSHRPLTSVATVYIIKSVEGK